MGKYLTDNKQRYGELMTADLDKTAGVTVQSRIQNVGQNCIAAKRFIVQKSVKKLFAELVLERIN